MLSPLRTDGSTVLDRLEAAWERSDALFALLADDAWLARPIPYRHPFLFYLGHLPAFAWNQVAGLLGREGLRPEFDRLFAFGIDPLTDDDAEAETRASWPERDEVLRYRDRVRDELRGAWDAVGELDEVERDPLAQDHRVYHVVLEHELMHHETLLYLLQELDPERMRPVERTLETGGPDGGGERVPIPAGPITLGVDLGRVEFAWDNELPERRRFVPAFALDRHPATVAAFRAFVEDGGYRDPELWTPEDRGWLARRGEERPHAWLEREGRLFHRTLFGRVPLEEVAGWPALVSHAEAAAYARWSGARLPSEDELFRAAYGTPAGRERDYPWGDAPPDPRRGNFDFLRLDPVPVGSRPDGASAFGVEELVGNGWEWTATDWAPHEGFETWHRTYPGYSSDFFDGEHKVLFGASWGTDAALLRRSFRNWFQTRYPYVFATFRCAWD